MRSRFYHNSNDVFDEPSYFEVAKRGRTKRYKNRALGLFASTKRQGLDHYGPQQYQFQLGLNSTVIELDFKMIQRSASWDYFYGIRRGLLAAGVDAIKARPDVSDADGMLIVLNFEAIEFWDRMRWENAFFQGMAVKDRLALLERARSGDLDALCEAFCVNLAPMGSVFWLDQYERLDGEKPLVKAAEDALDDAIKMTMAEL